MNQEGVQNPVFLPYTSEERQNRSSLHIATKISRSVNLDKAFFNAS